MPGPLLCQLRLGLVESSLERPGIDQKQHLSLFDELPFLVILLDKVSRYLGTNDRVDIPIKSADPFFFDRHILLNHFRHFHRRRWRCRLLLLFAAADQHCGKTYGSDCANPFGSYNRPPCIREDADSLHGIPLYSGKKSLAFFSLSRV